MRTTVLYEDEYIIVAQKPAGLATQTAKVAQADMVSELKNHIKSSYLGVVHRLDQPVEGVLVFGKTKAAAAGLSRQLAGGLLNKRYCAVVCGKPQKMEGELRNYLYKTSDNRAQIVAADALKGMRNAGEGAGNTAKEAVLRYRILESRRIEDCAFAEDVKNDINVDICLADIQIDTGRFHQIRAQMAHAGMPLLGDDKYGNDLSRRLSAALRVRNVALCACELQFVHPVKGESMHFVTEPQGEIFQQFTK